MALQSSCVPTRAAKHRAIARRFDTMVKQCYDDPCLDIRPNHASNKRMGTLKLKSRICAQSSGQIELIKDLQVMSQLRWISGKVGAHQLEWGTNGAEVRSCRVRARAIRRKLCPNCGGVGKVTWPSLVHRSSSNRLSRTHL